MRLTTLFILFLVSASVSAQGYWHHLKRQALPATLWYTSGFFDGAADMMRDKYSVSIFPQEPGQTWLGKDRSYWNPSESWVRKYRSWPEDTRAAFPGAKTWAVSLTDGWHLAKTLHLKAAQAATIMYRPQQEIPAHWQPIYVGQPPPTRLNPRWWWPLADAAIMSLSFSAGWHTAEALIIR